MERCIACERLEEFIAQAIADKDKAGQQVRARLLRDHQRGNCINRDWYTGHVRVMADGTPERESITLSYAGVWPGGRPAYTVERRAE